jgi:hypothetical protein
MKHNYTLKYRTFDQLLSDVLIDFRTFALEGMIEPQTLIKVTKRINYDLGLRINSVKQTVLEVSHNKVKLPDDFYTFNYAFICTDVSLNTGYNIGGTTIMEVPYVEVPDLPITCSSEPTNPYGDTNIQPRTFINCKGESWEVIQILPTGETKTFTTLLPLRMKASTEVSCDCPNLLHNSFDTASISNGFLHTSFTDGKVYLNYQGSMENEKGELLVPDHDLLNEYYEYGLKQRIIEDLYMNGEDVVQKLQLIEQRLKVARNQALSLVNTPNFKELHDIWAANRKAMYSKYYEMFKSYTYKTSLHNNRHY